MGRATGLAACQFITSACKGHAVSGTGRHPAAAAVRPAASVMHGPLAQRQHLLRLGCDAAGIHDSGLYVVTILDAVFYQAKTLR